MPFTVNLPEQPTVRAADQALMEAATYLYDLRRRINAAGSATEQDRIDARSAIDFITEFDPVVRAMQLAEGGPERTSIDGAASGRSGPTVATHALYRNPGDMTAGQLFVENERYAERGRLDLAATFIEVELGGSLYASNTADWRAMSDAQVRALIDSGTSDGTPGDAGFFVPVGQPIAPTPRQQRFFLRDLLSVQGTGLSSVPYIREYDPTAYELGASAVEEGAEKPEVVLAWEQDDAPVRKIAAWVPVTTEILDDAATLRGYIDTRLAYMLAVREERDLLFGDGNGGRIKGITQFSGLQTASGSDVPAVIAQALGKIEAVDGEGDGVAMNPIKYWQMVATRQSQSFDGSGMGNAPFSGPSGTVWGLPVVRSRAFATNDGLVGSFRQGATLFDRMRTVIRVGNQHSTYFVENKVAILAEERVALAVHRPDFFVRCTFSQ
jgi:HK97 family phage major capsid protein